MSFPANPFLRVLAVACLITGLITVNFGTTKASTSPLAETANFLIFCLSSLPNDLNSVVVIGPGFLPLEVKRDSCSTSCFLLVGSNLL